MCCYDSINYCETDTTLANDLETGLTLGFDRVCAKYTAVPDYEASYSILSCKYLIYEFWTEEELPSLRGSILVIRLID